MLDRELHDMWLMVTRITSLYRFALPRSRQTQKLVAGRYCSVLPSLFVLETSSRQAGLVATFPCDM